MTRLLIVAPNWLGDAVMALPAIADVRRESKDATITVTARPSVASLFSMVGDVNDVIDAKDGYGSSFDAAILLPNSFRSALDLKRAGMRERWGYRTDARRFLLTRSVAPAPEGTHQIDSYQHLVQALGFPNGPREPRLDVAPKWRQAGAAVLADAGWDGQQPLIALAPGAAYGAAKRWPPDYFGQLVRGLSNDGVRPVIVGARADESTAREIESIAGTRSAVINLVGRTDVVTLAGVLAHARAMVSNDSGALHLAAAIGLPVTALFGPTDERLTAPRSRRPTVVLTSPVWCRPCMRRECPLDHRCMREISVGVVADATRGLM